MAMARRWVIGRSLSWSARYKHLNQLDKMLLGRSL